MASAEVISAKFIDIINGFSPNLDSIYTDAKDQSIDDWKTKQKAMVTASGAAAMAIPGLHVAGAIADVAFVLNRMNVAAYGVGAIVLKQHGLGNLIEKEDFGAILGYWCDDEDIQEAMKGKGAATAAKLGLKVGGKGFAKAMIASAGYLVGQRLGGKAMAKAAAKFAGKFVGKLAGGFVPFLGPVVSAGVNLWLLWGIIDASEAYYRDKAAAIKGAA